jgi:hypothetical protein
VLAVGTDRTLWMDTTSDGWRWSGWLSLGGRTSSSPGVTVPSPAGSSPAKAVAVVRGTDNAAWYRDFTEPGYQSPSGWHSLGGKLISGVTATTVPGGKTYVVALGSDNQAWMRSGVWPALQSWTRP